MFRCNLVEYIDLAQKIIPMRHIQIFEYFQKTRRKKETTLHWSSGRLDATETGIWKGKGIDVNVKAYKKGEKNGIPYSSRTLFTFPNDKTILKSIKYMDGSPIGKAAVADLIDYGVAIGLPDKAEISKYDVVLLPESRSLLLNEFLDAVLDIDPLQGRSWNPLVIRDAFHKMNCNEVIWDTEKIDKVQSESTKNQILRIIQRMAGNTEKFRISDHLQFPPLRKFIKTFMTISPEAQEAVRGKKVLIIDDFVTDGTTKRQMRDLVLPFGPGEVMNLALFSIRGLAGDNDKKED
jgi:hypothetical protein